MIPGSPLLLLAVIGVRCDVQVVRLLNVVFDRLLRRPIELAQIADRFRNEPRKVTVVRHIYDAALRRRRRLVRVQTLVVHLDHRRQDRDPCCCCCCCN
uniref:Putative secreted protein n=1 Tax=Anopheles marajoara TaxID=58244 RepID=A0A2M4C968_9DIPT